MSHYVRFRVYFRLDAMPIEAALRTRIKELTAQARALAQTSHYGTAKSNQQIQQCTGWIAAALQAVEATSGGSHNAYFAAAQRIGNKDRVWDSPRAVGELAEILGRMLEDIDAGLLGSVADRARAETFDNFLDHGRAYLSEGRTQEAGVIVGVVFEDAIRRICRKHSVPEEGTKLDVLISELVKGNVLTAIKAKRARSAAAVGTSATRGRWEEFAQSDVAEAAAFTRELISDQLDI